MSLHPNWVAQVLRDRGVPALSVPQVTAYIGTLDPAAIAATELLVRAIQHGTEEPRHLQEFVEAVRNCTLAQSTAPAAQKVVPIRKRAVDTQEAQLADHELNLLRANGLHVYATKAAMKVELSLASRSAGARRYTVSLELARAAGERSYDWQNKLTFQFTLQELPLITALLFGHLRGPLTLGNHGQEFDKFLEVTDQNRHLFVKLRQGSVIRAVPVGPGDMHAWASICMTALRLNSPALDGSAHLQLLARVGDMKDSK